MEVDGALSRPRTEARAGLGYPRCGLGRSDSSACVSPVEGVSEFEYVPLAIWSVPARRAWPYHPRECPADDMSPFADERRSLPDATKTREAAGHAGITVLRKDQPRSPRVDGNIAGTGRRRGD